MVPTNTAFVLSQHSNCAYCGQPLQGARYGKRFCDATCRAEGQAEEQRAARRLWRESRRPMFEGERSDA